jgi:hypothetical protein
MNNTTFYFVITVLIAIDLVQSRYQRKLMRLQAADIELEASILQKQQLSNKDNDASSPT